MKYYTEPSREIPVAAETEVLVVGGGPAGFGAALHAARMGRKTMLIEQYGAVDYALFSLLVTVEMEIATLRHCARIPNTEHKIKKAAIDRFIAKTFVQRYE